MYLNYGDFLEKLILFDEFVLDSNRLLELPFLIDTFGYEAMIELLKSGALKVEADFLSIVSTRELRKGGQWVTLPDGSEAKFESTPTMRDQYAQFSLPDLPLGSYSFGIMCFLFEKEVGRMIDILRAASHVNRKELDQVLEVLLPRLQQYPDSASSDLLMGFCSDLETKSSLIPKAIVDTISRRHGFNLDERALTFRLEPTGKHQSFRTQTNLSSITNLDEVEIDYIVLKALLAVGSLDRCIVDMKAYSALSGFRHSDLRSFDTKIDFLRERLSPERQSDRFRRILSIKDFPNLHDAAVNKQIDMHQLLEIRNSREIREFRDWIWGLDELDDKELNERLNSVKSRLSVFWQGKRGKVIRWIASSGLGTIPGIGPILGPAASSIDTFIIDKLLKSPGPLVFINDLFPSIYDK